MLSKPSLWATVVLALTQPLTSAQSFIPPPSDVTSKLSTIFPGASLSWKQTSLCDTSPGVQSFSGFVTLPSEDPSSGYNASIFFWYFTARQNSTTAPTTIWLPGGPGGSFLDGSSGFPCSVNADGNSTTVNPWALNGRVNMLYVDVPVQTGYSYTEARNGSFDVATGVFRPGDVPPVLNGSTTVATLSSQDGAQTLNTTRQVGRQVWQFAQVWFQEFPEWHTTNPQINLWSYSYSGFFGAAAAAYIQQQNDRIANGTYNTITAARGEKQPIKRPVALPLGNFGTNNGCMDAESQMSFWPEMMMNNTYGIKAVSSSVYEEAAALASSCRDPILSCRAAAAQLDPFGTGAVPAVNILCANVTETCFLGMQALYLTSNRTQFDLALPLPGLFPPFGQPSAFYNQAWVQAALGVPVNFTLSENSIVANFVYGTGDPVIPDKTPLEYILSRGVGVVWVYGDRDYDCNWMGMENVSLSVQYPAADAFRNAGYAPIRTNASYQGGLVRQHGRVSFARVFEAGHDVAAYQPETVLRVFERAVLDRDVTTGEVNVRESEDYSTTGPSSSLNVTNAVLPPVMETPLCFWYNAADTQSCAEEQTAAVEAGTAVVEDWVVVEPAGVFLPTAGNPPVALPTGKA